MHGNKMCWNFAAVFRHALKRQEQLVLLKNTGFQKRRGTVNLVISKAN